MSKTSFSASAVSGAQEKAWLCEGHFVKDCEAPAGNGIGYSDPGESRHAGRKVQLASQLLYEARPKLCARPA